LSPALRNRFSEIWVGSVTKRSDLEMLIREKLKPKLTKQAGKTAERMLDFVEWLQVATNSPATSLRDLLGWCDFILKSIDGIGLESAFWNGGEMVFVDGFGINPLLKIHASQIPSLTREALHRLGAPSGQSFQFTTNDKDGTKFGSKPFFIPVGPAPMQPIQFSLDAQTTSKNAHRVLRAAQLVRPILLEGSPGVGKTSLISHLANVSGNPLVRINLSEQTDLMDLFGSDLPVEGGVGGEFAWRDGPFLQAMKLGHWVLLDELNLASQSVLEGLNACLDHRATVYVPELDRTFGCSPGFRVFAAQNPHGQGGGRKGLPKSFVNRFTPVYVDALTPDDLLWICTRQYPSIPQDVIQSMIEFNSQVHTDAMGMEFARMGRPWEFNLRDVFRWLDLMVHDESVDPVAYIATIYALRMRSIADRRHIWSLSQTFFAKVDAKRMSGLAPIDVTDWPLDLTISDGTIELGRAKLERKEFPTRQIESVGNVPMHQHLEILESVMTSIELGWMTILIGHSGSGKSGLVRNLAHLAGRVLVEFPMHGGIDTSDLLGGFEQFDIDRHTDSLISMMDDSLLPLFKQDSELDAEWQACKHNFDLLIAFAARHAPSFVSILNQHSILLDQIKTNPDAHRGTFEWVDGPLVKALENGHWLLLDNVNFCSPSVLDRLNPLLEPNGSLSINERGVMEDQVRKVVPHANFRLFMSMNPEFGEISRAMRNRGIELVLLETPLHEWSTSAVDRECDNAKVARDVGLHGLIESHGNLHARKEKFAHAASQIAHGVPLTLQSYDVDSSKVVLANPALSRAKLDFEALKLVNRTRLDAILNSGQVLDMELVKKLAVDPWLKTSLASGSQAWIRLVQHAMQTSSTNLHHQSIQYQRGLLKESRLVHPSIANLVPLLVSLLIAHERHPHQDLIALHDGLWNVAMQPADVNLLHTWMDQLIVLVNKLHHLAFESSVLKKEMGKMSKVIDLQLLQDSSSLWKKTAGRTLQTPENVQMRYEFDSIESILTTHDLWEEVDVSFRELLADAVANLYAYDASPHPAMLEVLKETLQTLQTRVGIFKSQRDERLNVCPVYETEGGDALQLSTQGPMFAQQATLNVQLSLLVGLDAQWQAISSAINGNASVETIHRLVTAQLRSNRSPIEAGILRDLAWHVERGLNTEMLHRLMPRLLLAWHKDVWSMGGPQIWLRATETSLVNQLLMQMPNLPLHQAEAGIKSISLARDALVWQPRPLSMADRLHLEKSVFSSQAELLPRLIQFPTDVKQRGVAWIQLGLATLQLLVPRVPMDPVAEPAVWLIQAQRRLEEALEQIEALSKHQLLLTGATNNPLIVAKRQEIQVLGHQIAELQKQVPLRPSPSQIQQLFIDLETIRRDYLGESDSSFSLMLRNGFQDEQSDLIQDNLLAIANRLQVKYPMYKDLVDPICANIMNIKFGMALATSVEYPVHEWLAYPRPLTDMLPEWQPRVASGGKLVILATLRRLHDIGQALDPATPHFSKIAQLEHSLFIQLSQEWQRDLDERRREIDEKASLYKTKTYGEALNPDQEAEDLQQVFPNFEAAMDSGEPLKDLHLIDRDAWKIWQLHRALVTGHSLDSLRALYASQEAFGSQAVSNQVDTFARQGSLLLLQKDWQDLVRDGEPHDFYRDSNMPEARQMLPVLLALDKRVFHLLEKWPDHAVLLSIATLCKRLASFHLSTPIMQFLTGMEMLLFKCQDWEAYASREVSIKANMADISNLIVKWRQLELASWKELLKVQDYRQECSAAKLWFTLHQIFYTVGSRPITQEALVGVIQDLTDVLLSSPVGEFATRLQMIKNLQQTSPTLHVVVENVHMYFAQFQTLVQEYIAKEKLPIEKELKEYLRIASWKDVNVYALRESAARTHRQLYKFVKRYQMLLSRSVTDIVSLHELALLTPQAIVSSGKETYWPVFSTILSSQDALVARMTSLLNQPNEALHIAKQMDTWIVELMQDVQEYQKEASSLGSSDKTIEAQQSERKFMRSTRRKAFVDSLKHLQSQGVSLARSSDFERLKDVVTLYSTAILPENELKDVCDDYFVKLSSHMRLAIRESLTASDDIVKHDVNRAMNALQHLWKMILTERNAFACLPSLDTHPPHEILVNSDIREVALAVYDAASHLLKTCREVELVEINHADLTASTRDLKTVLARRDISLVKAALSTVNDIQNTLVVIKRLNVPMLNHLAQQTMLVEPQLEEWRNALQPWSAPPDANMDQWTQQLDMAVNQSIQAVQLSFQDEVASVETCPTTIQQSHNLVIRRLQALDTPRLLAAVLHVNQCVDSVSLQHSRYAASSLNRLASILERYQQLCNRVYSESLAQHKTLCKLTLILTKSCSLLFRNGFCIPDALEPETKQQDEKTGEAGAGMGEGQGASNVSNEIENEEQAMGPRQEESDDKPPDSNKEDEQVEMENDFDGAMEDVSDAEASEEEEEEDPDDEQMGKLDGKSEAVDEKMWDEQGGNEDDKIEKDAPMDAKPTDELQAQTEESKKPEKKQDASENVPEKDEENAPENAPEEGKEDGQEDMETDGKENQEQEMEENQHAPVDMENAPMDVDLDLPDDLNLDDDPDIEDPAPEEAQEEEEMEVDASDSEQEAGPMDKDAIDELDELENPLGHNDEDDGLEEAQQEEKTAAEQQAKEAPNAESKMANNTANPNPEQEESKGADAQDSTQHADQGEGQWQQGQGPTEKSQTMDTPDPQRRLGEAMKRLKERLQTVREEIAEAEKPETGVTDKDQTYEHVQNDDDAMEEAMGAATEEQVMEQRRGVEDAETKDQDVQGPKEEEMMDLVEPLQEVHVDDLPRRQQETSGKLDVEPQETTETAKPPKGSLKDVDERHVGPGAVGEEAMMDVIESIPEELQVPKSYEEMRMELELEVSKLRNAHEMDLSHAHALWKKYDLLTSDFAMDLAEQLRLILEPTLATKLKGDYKTGKRLNMRKIIPYIASGFKKDKIWLRRTQPSKRQYQVLIAVDDSKSMSESHSIQLTYESVATIAKAMNQLEVGEVAVMRFGQDVNLVHPFDEPFGDEAGAHVLSRFTFDQDKTDVKQLMETSLSMLQRVRGIRTDLWQLQIIISDGICEDHDGIRSLIRRAAEEQILVVFIILDNRLERDSILNMTNVSYRYPQGKVELQLNRYMDTFPASYYVVIRDVNALPLVLSETLRQFFSAVSAE
jgi:midasin